MEFFMILFHKSKHYKSYIKMIRNIFTQKDWQNDGQLLKEINIGMIKNIHISFIYRVLHDNLAFEKVIEIKCGNIKNMKMESSEN